MLNDAAILSNLRKASFVANLEKPVVIPTQRLGWLGFVWDLELSVFKVSNKFNKRIENTVRYLHDIRGSMLFVSARTLDKLAGKIISIAPG